MRDKILGSTTDEIMASLILATHQNGVAGASTAAVNPDTKGIMMMFYFHPDAGETEMEDLLGAELQMTLEMIDPTYNMPIPPKDPRNMN